MNWLEINRRQDFRSVALPSCLPRRASLPSRLASFLAYIVYPFTVIRFKMNLLQACLYLRNSYYAQQVEVDMEELLIVILPGTEQILEVTKKYYRPSTMLVPCHSAGTCPRWTPWSPLV